MKQRIITAIFLIIGTIFVFIILPKNVLPFLMLPLALLCAWEWQSTTKIDKKYSVLSYSVTILLCIANLINPFILLLSSIIVIINYIYAFFYMLRYEKNPDLTLNQSYLNLIGPVLIATTSATIYKLSIMDLGINPFLIVLILVAAADSGAYFSGKFLGKHKLAPKISPNKTWEGVLGGLVLSIILASLLFSSNFLAEDFSVKVILLAVIVTITSIIGDLYMSVIKRQHQIKDTSNILPGHGGILDRIDGLLFALPTFYFLSHLP